MADQTTDQELGLALSGGGFRATLFHLGVVLYLRETNQLERVKYITSVSGGSILAGHLLTHWSDYVGADDAKLAPSLEALLTFCGKNQRRRLLRRYFSLTYWWFRKNEPSTRQAFAHLINKSPAFRIGPNVARLKHLANDRPRFLILCTDFETGEDPENETQVGFSALGLHRALGWPPRPSTLGTMAWDRPTHAGASATLGEVLATSAGFPGLFTPWKFEEEPSKGSVHRKVEAQLLDGGVMENSGGRALILNSPASARLFISDMGAAFKLYPDGAHQGVFAAANAIVRTTEVLTHSLRVDHERAVDIAAPLRNIVQISPARRGMVGSTNWPQHLTPDWFDKIRNMRTDLDAFTPVEQRALIEAGFHAAWLADAPSDRSPNLSACLDRLADATKATSAIRAVKTAEKTREPEPRERGKLATFWHEALPLLPWTIGAGVRLRLVPVMLVALALLGAAAFLGYKAAPEPEPTPLPKPLTPKSGFILDTATTNRPALRLLAAGEYKLGKERRVFDLPHPLAVFETEVTNAQWLSVLGYPMLTTTCDDRECPAATVTRNEAYCFANFVSKAEELTPCYEQWARKELATCDTLRRQRGKKKLSPELLKQARSAFQKVSFRPIKDCTGYRLPTEDEWESAAIAGDSTPTSDSPFIDRAFLKGSRPPEEGEHARNVRDGERNGIGLYHIVGNMHEITSGNDASKPILRGYGLDSPWSLPIFTGPEGKKAILWSRNPVAPVLTDLNVGLRLVRSLSPNCAPGEDQANCVVDEK